MNKKGQDAMEFIMTYGWAIIVVLTAIGALAYFGVLTPKGFVYPDVLILPNDTVVYYCPMQTVDFNSSSALLVKGIDVGAWKLVAPENGSIMNFFFGNYSNVTSKSWVDDGSVAVTLYDSCPLLLRLNTSLQDTNGTIFSMYDCDNLFLISGMDCGDQCISNKPEYGIGSLDFFYLEPIDNMTVNDWIIDPVPNNKMVLDGRCYKVMSFRR